MASIFSYQLLYPSWAEENKEKYNFAVTTMRNDMDVAMSWVENICLASEEPQGDKIEVKEDVSNNLSQEVVPFSANSEQVKPNRRRQTLLASDLIWLFCQSFIFIIKLLIIIFALRLLCI